MSIKKPETNEPGVKSRLESRAGSRSESRAGSEKKRKKVIGVPLKMKKKKVFDCKSKKYLNTPAQARKMDVVSLQFKPKK